MAEHNDYTDSVIAESYRAADTDMPAPLDSWSLEDFEDVVQFAG